MSNHSISPAVCIKTRTRAHSYFLIETLLLVNRLNVVFERNSVCVFVCVSVCERECTLFPQNVPCPLMSGWHFGKNKKKQKKKKKNEERDCMHGFFLLSTSFVGNHGRRASSENTNQLKLLNRSFFFSVVVHSCDGAICCAIRLAVGHSWLKPADIWNAQVFLI